jgi:hypothetical protein
LNGSAGRDVPTVIVDIIWPVPDRSKTLADAFVLISERQGLGSENGVTD